MESEDLIVAEIRKYMNDVADSILTARMSIEDYRLNQGKIEGAAAIERFILDLKTKQNED